jgi:hypothetical protein
VIGDWFDTQFPVIIKIECCVILSAAKNPVLVLYNPRLFYMLTLFQNAMRSFVLLRRPQDDSFSISMFSVHSYDF